jgi:hypothetical protein
MNGTWPIEVHFGLSAHIALTWVMAFSFLSAAVDFCDDGYDDTNHRQAIPRSLSTGHIGPCGASDPSPFEWQHSNSDCVGYVA